MEPGLLHRSLTFNILTVLSRVISSFFCLMSICQVCFRRLWARCEIGKATKTIARLGVLNDCIMKSGGVNAGNHSEQRITEDFYLNVFCPKAHFTLVDVLYELPRLCNSNELVPSCLLDKLPSSFIPSKSSSSPSLSSVQLAPGATTSKKTFKPGEGRG